MSKESAEEFLNKILNDNEFKNQLESAPDKESKLKLISSEGFDFTEEELDNAKSKLEMEELDMVAGGGWGDCGCGGKKTLDLPKPCQRPDDPCISYG
jgi:predicted ribosomally synthesized peptide with nif11-like leader